MLTTAQVRTAPALLCFALLVGPWVRYTMGKSSFAKPIEDLPLGIIFAFLCMRVLFPRGECIRTLGFLLDLPSRVFRGKLELISNLDSVANLEQPWAVGGCSLISKQGSEWVLPKNGSGENRMRFIVMRGRLFRPRKLEDRFGAPEVPNSRLREEMATGLIPERYHCRAMGS